MISKIFNSITDYSTTDFRYFQDLLDYVIAVAPVSIYIAIIASSPLSTMEPDVRDLRAVVLIGGMVNNKETDTIFTQFKYRIVADRRHRNSYI